MNKKFLLALALPAVMVGCSQEDLVSEGVVATAPEGKAIDNVIFNIAKNAAADGVESRADWVNNKIKFEASDKVSLYWLGDDKYVANADGGFTKSGDMSVSGAIKGYSNAVFRTEDGSKFTAEAVVYEGYNLLVYPANVKHTTAVEAVVSLPATQKAADDFAENAIYIGDSILHIHQPAKRTSASGGGKVYGKYYNWYGHEATTEDPNTSGYAHGISTGVKLLTSLLNMDLRIVNAPANDVKINKVVLTTSTGEKQFNLWGNLKARGYDNNTQAVMQNHTASGSKAQYLNPWFMSNEGGKVDAVTLSFDGVATNVSGSTKGTMLLLPTNSELSKDGNGVYRATHQPVLKVYTNYGVVTIGGLVADNDAQTNAIYKKDGIEKAAANDNQALSEIVWNATNYKDVIKNAIYDASADDKKQDYTINSGVSMTRVIKVDMAKAVMEGMTASTTEELNAILKAAIANPNNKFTSTNPLNVSLIPNDDKEFTLTDYEGLDAFVAKFNAGALSLTAGTNGNGKTTQTVVMNTTAATELKDVEGLADAITLTIPASSKINAIKNGNATDGAHEITNAIVNETTITLPKYSKVTISDNEDGKFIYTIGAILDVTALDTQAKYGEVYYKADTYNHMLTAANAGVNHIEVADVTNAFFNGTVNLSDSSYPANGTNLGGIALELNNCGDLTSTIEDGVKTATVILTNGSTYTNMTEADVDNVIVKSANAKLGMGSTNVTNKSDISNITIAEGTTVIEQINATTIEVLAGATATITADCVAPTNLYVWGNASFAGSNGQNDEKVFVDANGNGKIDDINAISGKCVVAGSLELKNNLAYGQVAVSATTAIKVAEGVKGLGYTETIHVSKAGQETGTANLISYQEGNEKAVRYSWDGEKFGTIQWAI